MIISIILAAVLGITLAKYIKWKLAAVVLAAWIAENGYDSPEEADIVRLKNQAAQKLFKL